MRFYLEYINHLGRLQKKSAHRRLQAGFTITEVLLAGLMMLIAVLVAGNGVINLLRSNYRANADSEIQNNLNRTLEFVSDEVRRARIIANSEKQITSTKVPKGAQAVLAFQIPDPGNPNLLLGEQIVYYTQNPGIGDSLTGPRVLWRYGPSLKENGNYDITSSWQHSPVTDMLAAPAKNPNCPGNFNRIPALGNVDDFYTCVRIVGDQVILNANAQVKMTTNEAVNYSVSTRVFPKAIWGLFLLTKPFNVKGDTGGGSAKNKTLPVLTVPAAVTAKLIKGTKPCTFTPAANPFSESACGVIAEPDKDWDKAAKEGSEGALDSPVQAKAGDAIVVHVNGLLNANKQYSDSDQTVDVYTSDSSSLPPGIDSLANNQILFVLTRTTTTPPDSYSILVTIEPK
ncbi:MAG: type II secretion system protein [Microcystis sp. LE19-84.1B]|uniref:PulJ/GspJ family protein n=1 Tax=Microcystis sp. LE19-84.1B TaxID=3016438 RepID=UPI0022C4CE91|nr:type II secretion system protein [Microcystis sp. LE19-84.1B]MCZ8225532.1 type II secretion system protein [Microcystis sp. LE19-84.1B]